MQDAVRDPALGAPDHVLVVGRLAAAQGGVQPVQRLLPPPVHENPVNVREGVIAGGALALEAGRQLLARLEDLFDEQVRAPGGLAEPFQVPRGIGEAVRMVDPQPVGEILTEPAHHFLVRLIEDGGHLDADAGQGVHREEPAVVELVVRAPPADEFVMLSAVNLPRGVTVPVAALGQREAVIVVPQLAVLDLELVQILVAAQDRDPDASAGKVPVDVERLGVAGTAPLLEQGPPPRVLRR